MHRVGKNDHGTSLYSCPHPECSDPPYTGDISGCGNHVRCVHLGCCISCPYCPDKKFYNADGWRRHMRNKHSKVPWYSGELQAPPESTAPATSEAAPAVPHGLCWCMAGHRSPQRTLFLMRRLLLIAALLPALPTSTPNEETKDPSKGQPPAPLTEGIERQLEFLPSDTRDYEYCTHSTGHPAAPVIISRYKRFDTPDECQEAAQALSIIQASRCSQTSARRSPLMMKKL